MSEKNKISVRIHGSEYTLISSEDVEYMQKIANYVDKKMNEITLKNNKLSTALAGVLAALNIADELYKKDNADDELRDDIIKYAKDFKELNTKYSQLEIENANLKRELQSLRSEVASLRGSSQSQRQQNSYTKPPQAQTTVPAEPQSSSQSHQVGTNKPNVPQQGSFNIHYNK